MLRRPVVLSLSCCLVGYGCASVLNSFKTEYHPVREEARSDSARDASALLIWTSFPEWEKSRPEQHALDAPENRCLLASVRPSRCSPEINAPVEVIGRIRMEGTSRPNCDPATFDCVLQRPPDGEQVIARFRTTAAGHGGMGLVFTEFILDMGPETVTPRSTARASVTAYVVVWDRSDERWEEYCRSDPMFAVCLTGGREK